MPSPQVLVVGSFMQDLTFLCAAFPRPGETIIGQFRSGPGGKGSNQAVSAARAGARVAYIGALGRDAFAGEARAFLAAEGIDCRLAEKAEFPTGTAAILVNAHGQNEIVVSLGANGALAPADIDAHAEVVRGAKVLVAQLECNLAATDHALGLARKAGVATILNPAPMRPDFDFAILRAVDILIPNETEFAMLVGVEESMLETVSDADLYALTRRLEVNTLIVTLGARGCFISQRDGFQFVPATRGIQAVDTTGAGDAFVGAFAASLAENGSGDLARAARFANVAAGISVTRPGTAPAMARRAEIDALLEATPPPGARSS